MFDAFFPEHLSQIGRRQDIDSTSKQMEQVAVPVGQSSSSDPDDILIDLTGIIFPLIQRQDGIGDGCRSAVAVIRAFFGRELSGRVVSLFFHTTIIKKEGGFHHLLDRLTESLFSGVARMKELVCQMGVRFAQILGVEFLDLRVVVRLADDLSLIFAVQSLGSLFLVSIEDVVVFIR